MFWSGITTASLLLGSHTTFRTLDPVRKKFVNHLVLEVVFAVHLVLKHVGEHYAPVLRLWDVRHYPLEKTLGFRLDVSPVDSPAVLRAHESRVDMHSGDADCLRQHGFPLFAHLHVLQEEKHVRVRLADFSENSHIFPEEEGFAVELEAQLFQFEVAVERVDFFISGGVHSVAASGKREVRAIFHDHIFNRVGVVFVHRDVVNELFANVGVFLDPEPNLVIVILHLALDTLGIVDDILRMLIDGASVNFPSRTPIIQIDIGMYLFYIKNKALQTEGFQVVAATEHSRKLMYDADLRKPTVIVMGSEEKGISKEVLKLCDEQLAIPMIGAIESLNVAAAAAIMLFEVVRQRIGE